MKASKLCLIAALAAGIMFAYSPVLRAQDSSAKTDAKTHQGRHGRGAANMQERLNKMAENLKLTADQKTKVEALMKEQIQKRRGLRDLSKDQRREKAKALHEEMNKKMKEILTADQYKQWEKNLHARRGARKQRSKTE
jgi:periplasmic protein CpxP/Spy